MFPIKILIGMLTIVGMSLSVNPSMGKNYNIDTVFNNIFKIDFLSGRKDVPLPPGTWKLVAKIKYLSGGDAFSVPMYRFYLIRYDVKNLTGVISIVINSEIIDSHWNKSAVCSEKRKNILVL